MGLFDQKESIVSKENQSLEIVIEGENLCKRFGATEALKEVSLQVPQGSVFALLGPNGAGKTTFVKCLLGLAHLDRGDLWLRGKSVKDPEARRGTAYLPEKFDFYPHYTVEGVLHLFGVLHGRRRENLRELVVDALKRLDIKDIRNQKLRTLSKGQLQRTGVAALLVSQSDILILDEPFSGLDPIGRKEIKDLFIDMKEKGKTLFINSHILAEMEVFCDHVAILNKGECLAQGEMKKLIGDKNLEDYFYETIQIAKEE